MKTIACIAEYNPFHLGHLKHFEYIKNTLKADNLIVIMSGNFTQRGEPAVLDKYARAKHAVIAGADVVIELPTVFATSNAETFAKGAIKILSSLNAIDGICFGVESGTKEEYIELATMLNDESKEYKKALKDCLEKGVSLAKAKFEALKALGLKFNEKLISSPNNILGVEYTKAILSFNSNIEIYPMLRSGDHNDKKLKKGITSATSIRETLKIGKKRKLKSNLPKFVYKDLVGYPFCFDKMIMTKLLLSSVEDLSKILDCTEGLENRIKALSKDNRTVNDLVEKTSTKRYTKTRINRILIHNLLGITSSMIKEGLSLNLYAKVLAVNSNNKKIISLISENSSIPIITRKSDLENLKKSALKCYEKDALANDLYALATNQKNPSDQMILI